MKIAVCIKQILDPELPPSTFEIDSTLKRAKVGKHALLMDPYSENALELALQIKDKNQDVSVTAITYGEKKAEDSLRKCLGVLADEAVHIYKKNESNDDTYCIATILGEYIKKNGPFELILCGRQAGDWDAGLLGQILSEVLELPMVSFASKIEVIDSKIKIDRYVENGEETLESKLPLLVTVTNDESNVLRIAKVKDVMKAHRKPIIKVNLEDLGINESVLKNLSANDGIEDIFIPEQVSDCEIIEAEEPADIVKKLLNKLKANKVL
jgi:electron transfer flavoprotein beta subunit